MDPLSLYLTYSNIKANTENDGSSSWVIITLLIINALLIAPIAWRFIKRKRDITVTLIDGTLHIDCDGNRKRAEVDYRTWLIIGERKNYISSLYKAYEKRFTQSQKPSGDFWRVFLELEGKPVTRDSINSSYKRLAHQYHPDKQTGSEQLMQMLNRAKDEAIRSIK